jgi:hypothetical protein
MTEALQMKILPSDRSFNWGALLVRMLPSRDTGTSDVLMSILRVLALNPSWSSQVPKFEDGRRFKISTIFRGQNVLQRVLTDFKDYASKHASKIIWPDLGVRMYEPQTRVACSPPRVLLGIGKGNDVLIRKLI